MNGNENGFGRFATEKQIERNPMRNCTNKTKTESGSRMDVCLNVDASLKSWTDNCVFRCKRNNFSEEKRSLVRSIYCEVLGNQNCTECTRMSQKLSSINTNLAKYPELETRGYLLFLSMREKQRKSNQISHTSALSKSVSPDSGYSSQLTWRSSPTYAEKSNSRSRVRTASLVASELNRLTRENLEKSSGRSPIPWRPPSSKNVRFHTSGCTGDRVSSSRSPISARRISTLSQKGWSAKQIEAWKLLAPTPPQIEVSQMNVGMYTPKELPGIKIFDESLFVI